MHQAIHDIWIAYNEPLEGTVRSMYADVLGLVSIGTGILIDPMPMALLLPFELPAGIPATRDDIARAWRAVKADPKAPRFGWKYAAAIPANNVRLSLENVNKITLAKLEANDRTFQVRFGDWDERPADAQLAVHSMAWGMGSYFWSKFPRFTKAFTAGDYAAASTECDIAYPVDAAGVEHPGTIKERNARNRLALMNASRCDGDMATLVWPASRTT